MTLTHVVMLKWKPGTSDDAVEPGLRKLGQIPLTETYVLSYRIGKDLEIGRTHTNHDVAIVSEFATLDDYHRYATSKVHLAAVALLRPHLMHRHAVQMNATKRATPSRRKPSNARVLAALLCGVAIGRALARR
jgi:hypothetical protein